MQELLDWLEYLEDGRQQSKVRHNLKDILVIVLFATLANADDWVEIAMFADYYQDYFRKYIALENGIPSHDTIGRVMGMISPEIIHQLYVKWQKCLDRNDGELLKKIICIDGKTMCGNRRNEEKPAHIVTAWSKEDGFSLGQKAVSEKSNEITAIPELLDKIQIKGQVVTIDAMGTQTAIAEKVKSKRADYVLGLKKNQGTLYENVREYFLDSEFLKRFQEKGSYKKTTEKAHGQLEIREYYQTEDIKWLEQKGAWKGLKSIIMERKTIKKGNKERVEYRYFISSLKEDIELTSRAGRGHWCIESMHWHLDVTFRDGVIEDVKALDNVETPSFFERAWNGLKLVWSDEEASSVAKRDIDAVSGATYSSQAIIENLRRAVNYYMEHYQHTEAAANAGTSGLGAAWWGALLVALASAILPFFIHNRTYRFIQLVLNVGVLGFWTGTFLSYTSFLSVFSNPVRLAMLPTMILLVTAFIVPLFGAGNRYCTWTCPFGSMQMLAGMAVKHKTHIGHRTVMALTWVRRGLWTVLMLLTWTGVFSEWIDYEIFTAFLVSSVPTFMLIIAGAFVLLSFVVERPFCRFVCPTGTIINISEINY